MAWRWMRNRDPEPEPGDGAVDVGAECEAFLAGRYLEIAVSRAEPIPGWVWLNRLAHASATELVALSERAHDPGDGWRHALAGLAGHILEFGRRQGVDVRSLQRDILVPLELQVMDYDAFRILRPEQLVYLVRDALREQPTGCP